MDALIIDRLIPNLLVVLAAGLLAGMLCKRLGMSLLVGYLVVGALVGEGGLQLVAQESHELDYLARAGALLLLFSVGIEFSLEELSRLSRFLVIGGVVQMVLVAVPLTWVVWAFGLGLRAAILAGFAAALSSTVLVFKALTEWGEVASPHGRRALGILLFQDIALVPLLLLVPLLTGSGEPPRETEYALLASKSILFVASVILLRKIIAQWLVPLLGRLRSVELVTLFALCVLGGACFGAYLLGLPPPVGALAAGLMLSGNRLSTQVDTIVLPFRETFTAVFFVTLGTLLHPGEFFREPLLLSCGLAGILILKSGAAAIALKLTGLTWRASAGMGLGLAQLGEFSFLLLLEGVEEGLISAEDYNRMLFIALGTLILTPQLLRLGLRWTEQEVPISARKRGPAMPEGGPVSKAIVVGVGPIGKQLASRLETFGVDVCLVDFSPINLHLFAQQGFHTVAGDARDRDVLMRADVAEARLVIICVPVDEAATQIVRSVRDLNPTTFIVVRCRYQANRTTALKAGANAVVSEEAEASQALLRLCESVVESAKSAPPPA